MQITGVSLDDFDAIVREISQASYKGNLEMHADSKDLGGVRRPRIRARVSIVSTGSREGLPQDESLPGTRRSWHETEAGNVARIHAACWHAYRDVLSKLFERFPDAVITTAAAKYKGAAGFQETYPDTAYQNIGSMMNPCYRGQACDC